MELSVSYPSCVLALAPQGLFFNAKAQGLSTASGGHLSKCVWGKLVGIFAELEMHPGFFVLWVVGYLFPCVMIKLNAVGTEL